MRYFPYIFSETAKECFFILKTRVFVLFTVPFRFFQGFLSPCSEMSFFSVLLVKKKINHEIVPPSLFSYDIMTIAMFPCAPMLVVHFMAGVRNMAQHRQLAHYY